MMCDKDLLPEDEENEEAEDPVAGFYEGWQDVMSGNTYPVSALWDDLDEE